MTSPAQLEIFPRRPRSGSRAVEFRLQCAIARLLQSHINPGWIWSHLPFGEYRPPATAAKLKAMGTNKGWPDLEFIHERGKICFLELKRHGGVRSQDQVAVAVHIMRAGCGYGCCDNFDDAVGMLKDWGILPLTIHPQ